MNMSKEHANPPDDIDLPTDRHLYVTVAIEKTPGACRAKLTELKTRLTIDDKPGKQYRLKSEAERAVLIVRPRGWHLDEKHVLIDGQRMSGGLFDLALFAFHNAGALVSKDRGPYFYLPKLQCMEEAALWNAVLDEIEVRLNLPQGAMKATVLIETLPAAFEMDEILWELRSHILGLNCGRWDYIFSYTKTLRDDAGAVLPDRASVTMTPPSARP